MHLLIWSSACLIFAFLTKPLQNSLNGAYEFHLCRNIFLIIAGKRTLNTRRTDLELFHGRVHEMTIHRGESVSILWSPHLPYLNLWVLTSGRLFFFASPMLSADHLDAVKQSWVANDRWSPQVSAVSRVRFLASLVGWEGRPVEERDWRGTRRFVILRWWFNN